MLQGKFEGFWGSIGIFFLLYIKSELLCFEKKLSVFKKLVSLLRTIVFLYLGWCERPCIQFFLTVLKIKLKSWIVGMNGGWSPCPFFSNCKAIRVSSFFLTSLATLYFWTQFKWEYMVQDKRTKWEQQRTVNIVKDGSW